MKLTFLGATETVTGSKYLIEESDQKILVDCGLFQGMKELRLRNWAKLPFRAAEIDAVILTHAHIDHSGYIPALVKQGFKGRIYCSKATYDLCAILLPDSGYLQEEDAERANRYGYSKHHPAQPLYGQKDAMTSLENFYPVDFNEEVTLAPGLTFTMGRAGHILGAAFVRLASENTSILFTGDMGRPNDPVMVNPDNYPDADYMVVESTYGDRLHEIFDPKEELKDIIHKTTHRGGTVLIPAFAVGRTQNLLYYIWELKEEGYFRNVPVFIDSPMATKATELLHRHIKDHRLSKEICRDVCNVATYTRTPQESKSLDHLNSPAIIISASGMATGGRVLHHLKTYLGNRRNTILFTGFQARGTRGDRLVSGETEIKIHGQMWPVHAQVENLGNTSAHADRREIMDQLGKIKTPPRRVFITHGEVEASRGLGERIVDELGWNVTIPEYKQMEELG